MVEFETCKGIEIVFVLYVPVIGSGRGPSVGIRLFLLDRGHGIRVMLLAFGSVTAPETLVVTETDGVDTFGAEGQTVEWFPFE